MLVLAQFEGRLSPAVMAFAALGVTVAVIIAISIVVFRVLQGPTPSAPQDVVELTTRRRAILRAVVICSGLWLLLAAADSLLIEPGRVPFICVFALLLAIPILLGFYFVARREDRRAMWILANPWVRWEYDPAEWRRIAAQRQGKHSRSLAKQTPQVIAGADGLIFGDKHMAWNDSGMRLTRAWTESQPAGVVMFRFEIVFRGTMTIDLIAPLPPRGERDLRHLREKLQTLSYRPEVRL
jgi:hypothetical protein